MGSAEDKIRLAEAMGWENCFVGTDGECYGVEPGEGTRKCTNLPDPFTDANDDYAVLEWSRVSFGIAEQVEMNSKLGHAADYRIGDFARAALKGLDNGTR